MLKYLNVISKICLRRWRATVSQITLMIATTTPYKILATPAISCNLKIAIIPNVTPCSLVRRIACVPNRMVSYPGRQHDKSNNGDLNNYCSI